VVATYFKVHTLWTVKGGLF